MKHTFKKAVALTAFAAALGLVTPAATVNANTIHTAGELKLAYQHGGTIEELTLQVSESEDLRFLGAPSNWMMLHPTWTSVNPEIASIDSSGVVTAHKTGSTAVILVLDNGMTGYAIVHVVEAEPVIENENVTEEVPLVIMTATQKNQYEFTVSFENEEQLNLLTKDNFQIVGNYKSEYGEFTYDWEPTELNYDAETELLTITGDNKILIGVTYTVQYKAGDTVLAESNFLGTKVENENALNTLVILLKNQEAIRVPSDAEFADGTSVENMYDIVRYAFSFATTSGDLIIPTYEADKYGIAEIAAVDYSAIKGPKTVIVKNVYFKVYLDLDKNGTVTEEEKTSDTAAFYYIKVVVDRTLVVGDWNMVQ